MVDFLLDVNIVLDICQPRMAFRPEALKALTRYHHSGGKMWVYTGSVQILEYNLLRGLRDDAQKAGQSMSQAQAQLKARQWPKR